MFLRDERHGRHAGRRAKAIETGGGRDARGAPGAATLDGAIVPARRVKTPSHRPRSVWIGVGLVVAARVLRSRHFAALVTVGGIVLVALAQMGWKVLVRVVRDLIAWDDARLADPERQLRHQRLAQAPRGAVLEGTVIPPPQPGASDRRRHAVVLGVGLLAAARVLRNRRFDEQVIVAVLALAALAQMSRKEIALAVKDLIAWDNARLADLQKRLRRQREAKVSQRAAG
jgi:hypothetical protein